MRIDLVKKEAVKDNSQVDVIRSAESKSRVTPAKLKELKQYLEQSIQRFQLRLNDVDKLLKDVYDTIDKK